MNSCNTNWPPSWKYANRKIPLNLQEYILIQLNDLSRTVYARESRLFGGLENKKKTFTLVTAGLVIYVRWYFSL